MNRLFILTTLCILALPVLVLAQTGGTSVDLIWEANTYTPGFYSGHSQISPESAVRVIALPIISSGASINRVSVNTLQFDWVKDGKQVGAASGVGQNVLIYKAAPEGGDAIAVTVSNPVSGEILATRQLILPVAAPKLALYEEDPLGGILYNRALMDSFSLGRPEVTLRAVPFFFSASDVASKRLSYDWHINQDKIVSDAANQDLTTFTAPTEGKGANKVTVKVENLNSLFQEAATTLTLTFNQSNNNPF